MVKKSFKNNVKSRFEASWAPLGTIFKPSWGPWSTFSVFLSKKGLLWVSSWGPFWDNFRVFSYLFSRCFFTTLQDLIFPGFSSISGVILESFFELFPASLQCAGRGYSLSSSHSRHYLEASVFTLFPIFFRTSVPILIFLTFSSMSASILESIFESIFEPIFESILSQFAESIFESILSPFLSPFLNPNLSPNLNLNVYLNLF